MPEEGSRPNSGTPAVLSDDERLSRPLEAEIEETLSEFVPPDRRGEAVHRVVDRVETIQMEMFAGPIAHPRHLEYYEQICPGSADRIIRMAEDRNNHQMRMEEKLLDADIDDQRRGMNWGGWLFALMVVAALIASLVTKNAAITAAFVGVAALGGIARFISGRYGSDGQSRTRSRSRRPEENPSPDDKTEH